ncbi:MAG: hypothetical protein IKE43_07660 [Coriobacteriales bacterium]|nr:hypothetical protein [Coriobacteriales bacterium]
MIGKGMEPLPADILTAPKNTGVDWCTLTVSFELLERVRLARSNEDLVRAMGKPALEQYVREIAIDSVSTASALAKDMQINTDELFQRCFALAGEPWSEAHERRDMRERIRVFWRIMRCGSVTPRSLDDMLSLWSESMRGEARWYKDTETARFRTSRVPFGHGKNPFEAAEPPAGKETVEASLIPNETKALLIFMKRTDLPLEVLAAA